ncbi:hypothetical protein N0M98_08910 [Paenibacillus doosanensis]|uniref:DUF4083 domain-containing protein n=1 Tax=Paenibacillus konkukensis TaxID=2020716 RepID=A0ABY4RVC3_9BACL|nr:MULTISPECIES: hypothetical protein [Paenibacillus]MCS7460261.1 hypothetical protein [Paenibacillus doosanensis]UQZ86193.1 hypothetical protein SK3146_05486 [Paenibacillus konkukensis]
MDSFLIIVLAAVAAGVLLRVRSTYKKIKRADKSEEIQRKLAELRRRREEE